MTLPVSTSSSRSVLRLLGERRCGCVVGGVVGGFVVPAAPDHADPGAGQDADGVGVVFACPAGVVVELGGPWAGASAVVGERGDRLPESLVARPPKVHGLVLAGGLGDRSASGQRGDRVGGCVGLAAVAPLGEYLGGVDLTRPWQRREDLAVGVLVESGGGRGGPC